MQSKKILLGKTGGVGLRKIIRVGQSSHAVCIPGDVLKNHGFKVIRSDPKEIRTYLKSRKCLKRTYPEPRNPKKVKEGVTTRGLSRRPKKVIRTSRDYDPDVLMFQKLF